MRGSYRFIFAINAALLLFFIMSSNRMATAEMSEKTRMLDNLIHQRNREMMGSMRLSENETRIVSLNARKSAIVDAFRGANRKLDFPSASRYAGYVMEASSRFGVDSFLIAAMVIKESHVKYRARSRYAYGLMQINWKVHRRGIRSAFPTVRSLNDLIKPRNNILAGTWIFSCYLKSSGGNVNKALSRYLGASGRRYIKTVNGYRSKMNSRYTKMVNRTLQGS